MLNSNLSQNVGSFSSVNDAAKYIFSTLQTGRYIQGVFINSSQFIFQGYIYPDRQFGVLISATCNFDIYITVLYNGVISSHTLKTN